MAPFIWSFEDGIIAKTNCKQYLTENAEAVEFSILGAWSNQMYLVNIICYNEALYRKGVAFPFINDNNNNIYIMIIVIIVIIRVLTFPPADRFVSLPQSGLLKPGLHRFVLI